MQYLEITRDTTLRDIADVVGSRNVEYVLRANNLERTPNIGEVFYNQCQQAIESTDDVSWQRKKSVLDTLVSNSDVFEAAALADSDEWKVLSTVDTLPGRLKIPDTAQIPDSVDLMGDGVHVSNTIYRQVMDSLTFEPHQVDPSIFNDFSTSSAVKMVTASSPGQGVFQYFKIPWGEVTLFSSLANRSIEFPVYPEEITDKRNANYTQMPDILYQYEPWYVYQGSGPRQNSYTFEFHRDMWTGDHRDGKAAELINFCHANCYPNFNGSLVNVSTVKLYISGDLVISGIMNDVSSTLSGPIGLDGKPLQCKLTLTITEIAETPLSFDTVLTKSLVG